MWQLAVAGDGPSTRRYRTFHGNADDAAIALDSLATDVRRDVGDLRVRELIGRYLYAEHDRSSPAFERDQRLLHDIVEPAYGDRLAVELIDVDIEAALTPVYGLHGPEITRLAFGLTRDAYRWARRQGWIDLDPTAGLTLRTIR